MSTISVNGKTYTIPAGKSISISNGNVYVDGKLMTDGPDLSGVAEIKWDGPLANLHTDKSVVCGDVSGNVTAGGHVACDEVRGSVTAGGHVTCDDVHGNVKAGGNVNRS